MNSTTAHRSPTYPQPWRYSGLFLALGAWFLLALALSLTKVYASTSGVSAFALPMAVILPVVLFSLAYRGSRRLRELVLGIDTRVLVLVHTWRTIGLGFLMLYAAGQLPAILAFPAGIGDAAAAVWALVLGVGLYGGLGISKSHLLAWNAFGMIDFIIAVSIGSLARYGFLAAFAGDTAMSAMGQLPMVLIPTFAVPALAIVHIVIYLQVINGRATGIAEELP